MPAYSAHYSVRRILVFVALGVAGLAGQQKQAPKSNVETTLIQAKKDYAVQKYSLALPLFRKAAQAPNGEAARYLGMMYEYGQGVNKDSDLAVSWYHKAAEAGDAVGM